MKNKDTIKQYALVVVVIFLLVSDYYWHLFFFCGGFVFGYVFKE